MTTPAGQPTDEQISELFDHLRIGVRLNLDRNEFNEVARAFLALAGIHAAPPDDVRSALVEHELLPCPFCGGTDGDIVGAPDRGYWAMCDSCGASTSEINNSTEADAIDAWNRRALAPHALAAQPLTEDEIMQLFREHTWFNGSHAMTNYVPLVRAVEARIGIAPSAQGEQ